MACRCETDPKCCGGHRRGRPRLIRAGQARINRARALGAPPGGCGAAYASLVQAAEGRTADSPHTLVWCNHKDVEAWHVAAATTAKLVRRAWNELLALENAQRNWGASQALNASVTAYENANNLLPGPSMWQVFGTGACSQSTAEHIAVIQDGACQLEQLNGAIQSLGGKAVDTPHVPPPGPSPWDNMFGGLGSGLGIVALVVVAGFLLTRKQQER